MSEHCTRCGNPNDVFQYCPAGEGGEMCVGASGDAKPISEMSREEVRAELEKAGLLKSTEWFNARILPVLLEDKRLRQALAMKDAEIEWLKEQLRNDPNGERGCMCVYCGETVVYDPAKGIQAAIDTAKEHDRVCPENPLVARIAELEAENADAKEAVRSWRRVAEILEEEKTAERERCRREEVEPLWRACGDVFAKVHALTQILGLTPPQFESRVNKVLMATDAMIRTRADVGRVQSQNPVAVVEQIQKEVL